MIGLTFSLSGMLVFMLYVMVNDFFILVGKAIDDAELFSHDTLVFQDYDYKKVVDKHPLAW